MKPILPAGLKAYKRTPIFDENTSGRSSARAPHEGRRLGLNPCN